MNTLFKTRLLGVLMLLLMTDCNQSDKLISPSEQLLNNLADRYHKNDYVTENERPDNPFEKQGKEAGMLFRKIRTALSNHRGVNGVNKNKDGYIKLASYTPTSKTLQAVERTFGIESPDDLGVVSDILIEHDGDLTPENIKKTNDELNKIPLTEISGLKGLDDAVSENTMTPLQRDLIVLHYKKLTGAKSKEELISISNTFETEVANSKIDNDEKNPLLLNCAMVRHMVLENPDIAPMKALNAQFRNTAVVVPFLITFIMPIAIVITSYYLGTLVGSIFCDSSSADYQQCLDTFGGVAVMLVMA